MAEDIGIEYLGALVLWALVLIFLLGQAWIGRRPVVGLSLAYWMNLSLIHLLGGIIQLLPWHFSRDRAFTVSGFGLTAYAMGGFLLGLLIPKPAFTRQNGETSFGHNNPLAKTNGPWLAWSLIGIGLLVYFAISAILRSIPSAEAILSNGMSIVVAGFCLLFWSYYVRGSKGLAWLNVAAVVMVPALTIVLRGFLGYGVMAMVSVAAFIGVRYSPHRTVIFGGAISFFLMLSLFTSYATVRSDIRAAVWKGNSVAESVAATSGIEKNWSWMDLENKNQLAVIEGRLNQNSLVGRARHNIESKKVNFADGETILDAFVALVPRFLWPDKPVFAGSGTLVSRFTEIRFAGSTSIGIGHVMELYINFGIFGVFVGYILLGYFLSFVDEIAGHYLQMGTLEKYLIWFAVGQAFLTVGGNFAESFPAAVGGVILCLLVNRLFMANWI